MKSHEARARKIQRAIGDALLRNWDPIGVKREPQARNEYDAYVAGVYRLLASGATARHIAEHLVRVETDQLGFADPDATTLVPLAYKLQRLYARWEAGGTAA